MKNICTFVSLPSTLVAKYTCMFNRTNTTAIKTCYLNFKNTHIIIEEMHLIRKSHVAIIYTLPMVYEKWRPSV